MKRSFALAFMASVMMFTVLVSVACPSTALGRNIVAVEGAKFDASMALKDNLKIYVGKDVVIHLKSGKSLQGCIKAVGDHLVHIEKLAGRDFYDALIRIDDISAMEAKFREMK